MDPPASQDAIGHFSLVVLNLKKESFQYIDSLYNSNQSGGWKFFKRMMKNISELWESACHDMTTKPLSPLSLANHISRKQYLKTPKQDNE